MGALITLQITIIFSNIYYCINLVINKRFFQNSVTKHNIGMLSMSVTYYWYYHLSYKRILLILRFTRAQFEFYEV